MTSFLKQQWTEADTEALKAFGRQLAKESRERAVSYERWKAAWDRKWLNELRKREDPLSWEAEMDAREGDTYW